MSAERLLTFAVALILVVIGLWFLFKLLNRA